VYHSRGIKPFSVCGNARRLPLNELLRVSDVVTLHCPFSPETEHIIGRGELEAMKPTAFLLNTGRGRLIDETALIEALEAGRIAGAALDVFETEPEVSDRLKALENVVLTPHIGSNTLYTRNGMAEQCVLRIRDALEGREPRNLLNPRYGPVAGEYGEAGQRSIKQSVRSRVSARPDAFDMFPLQRLQQGWDFRKAHDAGVGLRVRVVPVRIEQHAFRARGPARRHVDLRSPIITASAGPKPCLAIRWKIASGEGLSANPSSRVTKSSNNPFSPSAVSCATAFRLRWVNR
jgi:hypothetical protein